MLRSLTEKTHAHLFRLHAREQTIRHALHRRDDDIIGRVDQHRAGVGSKFTSKYRVQTLVWFQQLADVREAIQREKTMKEWPRAWKTNLIERDNPHWVDLYPSLPGVRPVTPL